MKTKEMSVESLPEDLTTFAKTSILSLLVLLNIEISQMGYLLILILVDSVTGMARAIKLKEGLSFQIFVWGIISKIGILIIPLLIASFALIFKIDLIYLVQAFIYIIATNDLISVITNIASMRSGKKYKNVDFIENGIHLLMDWFTVAAETVINKVRVVMKALSSHEDPKDPDQPDGQ